ncbi:hypothetical protein [Haladaptatus caseinilyticus]|uniref:hypothetical protein n=1 Tax=Haladaptatus caseinilyticus TaxID=2993314 RepID=UPI00224AF43F|nr:hypothetical protein [Haladaptatus caseinilyticus]
MTEIEWTPKALELFEELEIEPQERFVKKLDKVKDPITCESPADTRYEGTCKHQIGVAIRTPHLQAATDHSLVADGGTQIENNPEANAEDSDCDQPADCDCDGPGGFPCWPCVRSGRRDLPDE